MWVGSWLLSAFLAVSLPYLNLFLPQEKRLWKPANVAYWKSLLAAIGLALGVGVGIYTGVLLGGLQTRPLQPAFVSRCWTSMSTYRTGQPNFRLSSLEALAGAVLAVPHCDERCPMRKILILAGVLLLVIFGGLAAAQVSFVLGVAPNFGNPGQTITTEVKGVGFPASVSVAQVNFGAGITVTSVQVLPSQTMVINGETVVVNAMRVSASIAASAALGARRVTIGTLGGYSAAVFQVVSSGGGGTGGPTGVAFQSRIYPARADAPEGLVAADANRDHLVDLVAAPDGDRSLSLFRSLAGGGFAPARKIPGTIFGSAMIAAADVNGDGRPDLITGSRSATTVGVWIASGIGWRRPVELQVPAPAWAVGAGDFNGDGAQDIVAVVRDLNEVAMFSGNGNGTFQAPIFRPVGDTPKSVTVADLNKDGLSDAVVGNFVESVSILMGNRTAGLSAQRRKNSLVSMENLVSADFNGDGNVDVAVIGGDSIVILRGKGNGDFLAPPKRIRLADYVWDLAAADFNGDGKMDIAFVNFAADQVSVMVGKGNLVFESPFSFTTGDIPTRILAADFNNDGRPDIAVSNYGADSISAYLNQINPSN